MCSQISFLLTRLIFHGSIFVSKPLPNSYNSISAFGDIFNKIVFCRSEMVPKQCNSEKQKHRVKDKSYLEKLVNMALNFLIKCPSALLFSYYSLYELQENKINIILQCVQHHFITMKRSQNCALLSPNYVSIKTALDL